VHFIVKYGALAATAAADNYGAVMRMAA